MLHYLLSLFLFGGASLPKTMTWLQSLITMILMLTILASIINYEINFDLVPWVSSVEVLRWRLYSNKPAPAWRFPPLSPKKVKCPGGWGTSRLEIEGTLTLKFPLIVEMFPKIDENNIPCKYSCSAAISILEGKDNKQQLQALQLDNAWSMERQVNIVCFLFLMTYPLFP